MSIPKIIPAQPGYYIIDLLERTPILAWSMTVHSNDIEVVPVTVFGMNPTSAILMPNDRVLDQGEYIKLSDYE